MGKFEGEELNEEINEEEEVNELYRDVNVNLEGRDTKMTDVQQTNVHGFILKMLNPKPDTGIDFILNLNTEPTSLVDVPVSTTIEMPPSSATTIPPPPLLLNLGINDTYLAHKKNEAVKTLFNYSRQTIDEAQAKMQISSINTINEQLKAEILTRSSNKAKTSHDVAANLSELELKKILIYKIESNKSIHRSDHQKTFYKALVDAYESDKLILDTYGDTVMIKRRQDNQDEDEEPSDGSNRGSKRRRARKELESTSAPKEKTSKSSSKSKEGSKSHHTSTGKSAHAEEPIHVDKDLEEPAPHRNNHWINNTGSKLDTRDSFNELMDTPLDSSAFMMNRLKVDTLTPELLPLPNIRVDERIVQKSCDGTLNDVRTALDDILKRIGMKYLPQTYWKKVDKDREQEL
ncbi:hypothetical protein Tco_1301382 [Tanacetum coccineum]